MDPGPCTLKFWKPATASRRPVVAISSCLAGNAVRYDGGDKRLELLPGIQSQLKLVPFCPETAAGLGVPRPPVQLVGSDNGYRAIGRDDPSLDVTAKLATAAAAIFSTLRQQAAVAIIFQSRSPSCGLGSTPVFDRHGRPQGLASGVAATALTRRWPTLLAVEDTLLQTPEQCDRLVAACRLALEGRQLDADVAPLWLAHYAAQFGLAPPAPQSGNDDPWRWLLHAALLPWLQA